MYRGEGGELVPKFLEVDGSGKTRVVQIYNRILYREQTPANNQRPTRLDGTKHSAILLEHPSCNAVHIQVHKVGGFIIQTSMRCARCAVNEVSVIRLAASRDTHAT